MIIRFDDILEDLGIDSGYLDKFTSFLKEVDIFIGYSCDGIQECDISHINTIESILDKICKESSDIYDIHYDMDTIKFITTCCNIVRMNIKDISNDILKEAFDRARLSSMFNNTDESTYKFICILKDMYTEICIGDKYIKFTKVSIYSIKELLNLVPDYLKINKVIIFDVLDTDKMNRYLELVNVISVVSPSDSHNIVVLYNI